MSGPGYAVLYALLIWWFTTGAVLYLVGMRRETYSWSMAAASVAALISLYALYLTSGSTSVTAAYVAFSSAIVVWGWHEISFLTGFITGPRTTETAARPKGQRAQFWASVETLLYHEAAILATALLLYVLLAASPNQVGLWTFVILWVMRLSAKLNVYFGVPNLTEEFLPQHLVYLKSYFCHRPMNLLFPISVTLSTVVTAFLVAMAAAPAASAFDTAGAALLASLMGLAVLEHWFLVIPIPSASLWTWGLSSRKTGRAEIDTINTTAGSDISRLETRKPIISVA